MEKGFANKRDRKEKQARFAKLALYDLASLGGVGYGAYLLANGNRSGAIYIGFGIASKIIEYRKLWRGSS